MRVSEIVTSLLQSQIDAARTAIKYLITPAHNAVGYGAIGDGVINDAAAIQAAIDKNEFVFLPPGTFNLGTTSLKVKKRGQIIQGSGIEITILVYTGTGAAIRVEGDTSDDVPHNITLSDFTLRGSNTGAYGLSIGKSSGSPAAARGTFRNILAYGFATAGFRLVSSQIASFYNCDAEKNAGVGFLLDNPSGGDNTATTFYNCRSVENGQQGVYIKNCFLTCNFYNLVSEANGYEGVRIDSLTKDMYNLRFDNLHTERNNTGASRSSGYYEVFIDTGAQAIRSLQWNGGYLDIGTQLNNHALYMAGDGSAHISSLIATSSTSGPAYGTIAGTWGVRGFGISTSAFTVANTVRGHFFDVGSDGRLVIESTKSAAKANYVAFGFGGGSSCRGFELGGKKHTFGTQTPAYGSDTWAVGDVCWNTAPVPGGALDWVCTVAGTPGTWTIGEAAEGWTTIATAGATPSVLDLQRVKLTQTGATNVTNFGGGYDGAELIILAGDGNTTLVHDVTKIKLRGGANVTLSTGQIVELYRNGAVWTQML